MRLDPKLAERICASEPSERDFSYTGKLRQPLVFVKGKTIFFSSFFTTL